MFSLSFYSQFCWEGEDQRISCWNQTQPLSLWRWKLYRQNNALQALALSETSDESKWFVVGDQVPADHGGLRMNITRKMFDELRLLTARSAVAYTGLDSMSLFCHPFFPSSWNSA